MTQFFNLEKMFNCGCASDVNDDGPHIQMYNQASYESSDGDYCSAYDSHFATQTESAQQYFDRIQNLSINQHKMEMQSESHIPISPISTEKKEQQDECPSTPIKSNTMCTVVTPVKSNKTVDTKNSSSNKPRFDIFKLAMSGTRSRHPELRHTNSDCTQSTQSLSDSDDMSFDSDCSCHAEAEQPPSRRPLVSILRRKEKLGPKIEVSNERQQDLEVRFVQGTKFSDPNEKNPVKRKQVPRLTPKQKQEYALNQGWLSPEQMRLIHAAGPSLVITTRSNNKDFYSNQASNINDNMSHADAELRRLERVERRMEQNQFQMKYGGGHHQRHHTSEEQLLATLGYNESNGFYTFR